MSRAWPLACLLCLLISGVPAVISAADPFPQTMDIAGKTLKKNGEALCEWGPFGLDLYRVAMWVETCSSDAEKLLQQNQVRCIELFFLRSLSQKQMRKAYRESMRANQPADDEAMNESIEKFLNTVQAAAKGSRMRLVCLPDWGVIVQQGDKKTLIHGKRPFNDLIMKMYIGKRPPTPAVAKGLLGNHPKVITDTCLLCLLSSGVPAVISAADPLPQTMDIAGKTLKKNGEALCERGIFGLDLYRVAMWVETPSSDAEKLLQQNQVRCIELFFHRSLSQKQMRKAYRESMRANQPDDDEAMNESIEKFLNTVQAAAKGSRMRLICLPDWGVIVQQGDKKTLIQGKRPFNDLIMKMYIGKRPPTPAVAKGLLGNHPKVITDTGDGTAEAGEKLRKVPTPDAPRR